MKRETQVTIADTLVAVLVICMLLGLLNTPVWLIGVAIAFGYGPARCALASGTTIWGAVVGGILGSLAVFGFVGLIYCFFAIHYVHWPVLPLAALRPAFIMIALGCNLGAIVHALSKHVFAPAMLSVLVTITCLLTLIIARP